MLVYRNHDPANAAHLSKQGIQLALGTCGPSGLDSKFLLSSAARAVAEECFRSDRVLGRLLEAVGGCASG